MQVSFVCFGPLRDAVGQKTVQRDVAADTVGGAVDTLGSEFADLEPLVFDSDGDLRPNCNVLVNDENVRTLDGSETELQDGDTVTLAPGVAGGAPPSRVVPIGGETA